MPRVITGGQTGADQAGWRAAKACGIQTSGWMPRGFMTEEGPRPEFSELYGARETPSGNPAERTRLNVELSDGTFLFVRDEKSPGTSATIRACEAHESPWLKIRPGTLNEGRIRMAADWIREHAIARLNVAGHRESKMKGIGEWVECFCRHLFEYLAIEPD